MRSRGQGRIVVWQGGSLWVLEAPQGFGDADFHAHHAIQITLALDGEFELRTAGESRSGPVVGVAADASHIFEARGLIGFLFVEPESRAGRAIADRHFGSRQLAEIDLDASAGALARLGRTFSDALDTAELVEVGRSLVGALAGDHRAALPDRRVAEIIAHAASHPDENLSLADAADRFGISHSRLRHLFVEQTGLPFKTYLLWLRLTRAVEVYAQGHSLTTAAHEAGFADSAHFSRTFRRTFGLPATTLTLL